MTDRFGEVFPPGPRDGMVPVANFDLWHIASDEGEPRAPAHIQDFDEIMLTLCRKSLIGGLMLGGVRGKIKVCGPCMRRFRRERWPTS